MSDNKPQTGEQEQAPAIGVQDIENAIKVIDHACEQGAFKGWEVIQQVITVRDRLASFVLAVKPHMEGENKGDSQ